MELPLAPMIRRNVFPLISLVTSKKS